MPLVHRMLPPGRRVGILTVNAASLGDEHLRGAGIGPDIPLAVAGLEGEKEFTRVLLGDEAELDVDQAREEHVRVARRLAADHPDLGALVLECTNMPPYAPDIQRASGLPVFDIVSLVTLAHGALVGGSPAETGLIRRRRAANPGRRAGPDRRAPGASPRSGPRTPERLTGAVFEPLRDGRYRLLWLTGLSSNTARWMDVVVLGWLALSSPTRP